MKFISNITVSLAFFRLFFFVYWFDQCRYSIWRIVWTRNLPIITGGFCNIQNSQGGGKGYHPKPKAEVDNPYRDLDFAGY